MPASLIVAMTPELLIGRENSLPWSWPEDLRHFKRHTKGHTILMGRKSYEALGQPLPDREHLVISRSIAAGSGPDGVEWDGVRHFGSLADAFGYAETRRPRGSDHVWVLGGGEIFRAVLEPLDVVDASGAPGAAGVDGGSGNTEGAGDMRGVPIPERLVVTWLPSIPVEPGDVFFPFDRAWIEARYDVAESRRGETGPLEFVTYQLRSP